MGRRRRSLVFSDRAARARRFWLLGPHVRRLSHCLHARRHPERSFSSRIPACKGMLGARRDVVNVRQRLDRGRIEAVGARCEQRSASARGLLLLQALGGGLAQRQVRFRGGQSAGGLDEGRVGGVHGLVEGRGDGWAGRCFRASMLHAWRSGWMGAAAGFTEIGGSTRLRRLVIAVNAVAAKSASGGCVLPEMQWHAVVARRCQNEAGGRSVPGLADHGRAGRWRSSPMLCSQVRVGDCSGRD